MTLPAPYYDHAGITIYHGDCRDILPQVGLVDCFLTDPPYGVEGGRGHDAMTYQKAIYAGKWVDNSDYIESVCVPAVSKLTESCKRGAVTPGRYCMQLYPRAIDIGCFWHPAAATHGRWGFNTFTPILYYGLDFRGGKCATPSGIQVTESGGKWGHPCPKPLKAWTWLLNKVCDGNETVIDIFMGSGTTLVAAKQLGRKAIGIEIEEKYCEIAVKRLAQEVLDL